MIKKSVAFLIMSILSVFCGEAISSKTIILRPSLKDGQYVLTQNMISSQNTKYVLRYHCKLAEDISIPPKCTIEFDGGYIEGEYRLNGNETKINASLEKIFGPEVLIVGTWDVKEAYPQWFGAIGDNNTDDTYAFVGMFNFPCKIKRIPAGDYSVMEIMSDGINNSIIYGEGATLHYSRYNLDDLTGEKYGQVLCNYTVESKPNIISHDLGDITIYGLSIDGHKERFSYKPVATKITSIINHHALRVICGGKVSLYNCEFRNTFMTAVICEGCQELLVDNCRILHSGECENYTPYGYHYTWEGVGLDDRCYLGGKTQYISCNRCIVRNSYFEDIAGSYASANCKFFECYNNKVYNNRGYLHEISGHIEHGPRTVLIHDNYISGLGSTICMLNNFNVDDGTKNRIKFYNNIVDGFLESEKRTIPSATQLWYENYKYGPVASGHCKTIISNNKIICSTTKKTGNFTINSNECIIKNNKILNYGNGDGNNQLFYLPKGYTEKLTIKNNVIQGVNAYCLLLNSCSNFVRIINNKIAVSSQQDALSSVVRANWADTSSTCSVVIKGNHVQGLQYIYSSGANYNGHLSIKNNDTDASIGVYFNNPIFRAIDCEYKNNVLKIGEKSKATNVMNGFKKKGEK